MEEQGGPNMSITIEVDTTVHAAYIALSAEPVARTVEFSEEILVDLDEHGIAVGIEVLNEGAELPFSALLNSFHVHSDVVALLRLIRPSVSAFMEFTQGSEGGSTARSAEALVSA